MMGHGHATMGAAGWIALTTAHTIETPAGMPEWMPQTLRLGVVGRDVVVTQWG